MKEGNIRIAAQFRIILGIIFLTVLVLAGISRQKAERIWERTEILYFHPFQTRGLIDAATISVWAMRVDMRDLLLAEKEKTRQAILADIDAQQAKVAKDITSLRSTYLGPPSDIDEFAREFKKWVSIRAESMRLVKAGRLAEALPRHAPGGIAPKQALKLLKEMQDINKFAANKAVELYADAKNQQRAMLLHMAFMLLLVLALCAGGGYQLHRAATQALIEANRELKRKQSETLKLLDDLKTEIAIRKQAEEAVRRNERELNESQRIAHIGGWDWDAKNDIIRWSEEYFHIYGLDPDKPTPNYSEHLKAYTPESSERLNAAVNRAMASGAPYELDLELAQTTGPARWVVARGEAKRDANGKIWGLRGTSQDITERKQVQESILRSQRLYLVLSRINEAILRIREPETLYKEVCRIAVEDGRFKMAWIGLTHPETLTIEPTFNYGDTDGYLGKAHITLNPKTPEGRGPTATALRENRPFISNNTKTNPVMLPWREEALKRGYLSSAAFPLSTAVGVYGAISLYAGKTDYFNEEELQLLYTMAKDISFAIEFMDAEEKRRRAEEEILKLNAGLERKVNERTFELTAVNQELNEFTSSVSHDLRAPLRHVAGFVKLLEDELGSGLNKDARRYMEVIRAGAAKMGGLIDHLLEFSRMGRVELTQGRVDLAGLVDEARLEVLQEAAGKDIEWVIGALPEVGGDPNLLRQVLINLLGNAIKYTSKTDKPRVEISARREGRETVVSVRDNGAGFDMKYADKLFRVFQRIHSDEEFKGIGIGLASVRRIINRHGGRTWAEGEVNKGAAFYFSLPERGDQPTAN